MPAPRLPEGYQQTARETPRHQRMAEADARPWHEAKGLELGNWLRNKCPQRQFGGQAKVDGLVRTLTAAHERLEKAETDEERAFAWAHVALDLEASCKSRRLPQALRGESAEGHAVRAVH